VAGGVSYFTAAGNIGNTFAQRAWTAGSQVMQTVTVPANTTATLTLQWDAPYDGVNPPTLSATATSSGVAPLASKQVGTLPVTQIEFPNLATARTYQITIAQTPGTPTPTLFKTILVGGGNLQGPGSGAGSGSIFGHALVPGVNAVGAVNWGRAAQPVPAPYSSTGPGALLFAADGARLASPQTHCARRASSPPTAPPRASSIRSTAPPPRHRWLRRSRP
jgi:hypothetical protein